MSPEILSNKQLLNLVAMFACLGLGFAGLVVFTITGGFSGRSKHKKRKNKQWAEFDVDVRKSAAELLRGPPAQDGGSAAALNSAEPEPAIEIAPERPAPRPDLPRQTSIHVNGVQIEPTQRVEEVMETQPVGKSGGLLKSGGRLNVSGKWDTPDVTPEIAQATGAFDDLWPATVNPQPKHRELLRVLVHPETREIVVEIDGQQYETIAQIKDRVIGKRLLEVASLLLRFSRGMIATTTGFKVVPIPQVTLSELPPKSSTVPLVLNQIDPPALQTQAALLPSSTSPVSQPTLQKPVEKKAEEDKGLFGRLKKPDKPLETPGFNLAAEIDIVVQQKLTAAGIRTPVRVGSGLDGFLRIEVADNHFNAVDEVEPADIRELIQEAIAEWNRR